MSISVAQVRMEANTLASANEAPSDSNTDRNLKQKYMPKQQAGDLSKLIAMDCLVEASAWGSISTDNFQGHATKLNQCLRCNHDAHVNIKSPNHSTRG